MTVNITIFRPICFDSEARFRDNKNRSKDVESDALNLYFS